MSAIVEVGKQVVKHALLRTISVISVLLVIAGLSLAVYFAFIRPHTKPNPTTTQNAENISNYYPLQDNDSFFFGVKLWGLKLGISKERQDKLPVITEEE